MPVGGCYSAVLRFHRSPDTSRPQRIYEVNGRDYHFISRQRMEWEIRKGRFMEHGEFAGNLYGTSLDSLRALMATGYTAVLTPHLHALKLLRSSEVRQKSSCNNRTKSKH